MKKIVPAGAILIPNGAKKVFNGQIFDAYQWQQKMYDGSESTFEMLKRRDTVQIVAIKDDKLVLVRDQQPGRPVQIYPPRGRVDKGDSSWLEAAKREMLEETGMAFGSWRLVEVTQPAAKVEWFVSTFLATDFIGQDEQHLDNGEHIDVWLETMEDVRKLTMGGEYVSYLKPFFAGLVDLRSLLNLPEFSGKTVERS